MRQKALEIRKAQTLERIERKLDLLAKAFKVDFSQLESTSAPEPEPIAPAVEPEQTESAPEPEPIAPAVEPEQTESAPEREEIAPEVKTRGRK